MRGDKEFPVFNTIPASVFTKKKKKKINCSQMLNSSGFKRKNGKPDKGS